MSDAPTPASGDSVLDRRARIARAVLLGQRVGYSGFALAVVLFVVGFVIGFNGTLVAATVAALVIGSIVLAPAIVFGYAVKAADRDDREHGRL